MNDGTLVSLKLTQDAQKKSSQIKWSLSSTQRVAVFHDASPFLSYVHITRLPAQLSFSCLDSSSFSERCSCGGLQGLLVTVFIYVSHC